MPNVLTIGRIVCSFALPWLALEGRSLAFVILFLVLVLSDWLDGKLAILLDQRSALGARLDSLGDVLMYGCLLFGVAELRPAFLGAETVAIGVMLVSYAVVVALAILRFRRLPTYHTRAAKTCWLLASVGAITLLLDGPEWPARVAMACVVLTNLEGVAITLTLREWQADVASIVHACRARRRGRDASDGRAEGAAR